MDFSYAFHTSFEQTVPESGTAGTRAARGRVGRRFRAACPANCLHPSLQNGAENAIWGVCGFRGDALPSTNRVSQVGTRRAKDTQSGHSTKAATQHHNLQQKAAPTAAAVLLDACWRQRKHPHCFQPHPSSLATESSGSQRTLCCFPALLHLEEMLPKLGMMS